jgi:hypothetical protein
MSDLKGDLQIIKSIADRAMKTLEKDETVGLTAEMVEAIERMDNRYEEYCKGLDEEWGEEPGTTYDGEYGPSIEFYIEADDWHTVSRAFRKLKQN